MAILKSIRLDTGVSVSYHTVTKIEIDDVNKLLRVDLKSHADEESALNGLPAAWCWSLSTGSVVDNVYALIGDLETYVVNTFDIFKDSITTPDLTNSLTALKRRKMVEIRTKCEAQIYEGFKCSALGEEFLYPAKSTDQTNLMASVTDSLIEPPESNWTTPFWCADEDGVWEFRDHSVAQIQVVGRCGKVAILDAMRRNEIIQRIIQASSEADLQGITWDMNLEPYA